MYFNKIILPVLAVALNTVNAQLIDPIDMTDGHWSIDTRNSTYPVVRFHGALEATDAPAPPGHPHRRWGDFPAPNDAETRCHEWEIGPNDGDFFTNLKFHELCKGGENGRGGRGLNMVPGEITVVKRNNFVAYLCVHDQPYRCADYEYSTMHELVLKKCRSVHYWLAGYTHWPGYGITYGLTNDGVLVCNNTWNASWTYDTTWRSTG